MGLLYKTDNVPARKAITFCTESNCQPWELHFNTSKALQNYHISSATFDFSLQTYHFPTITLVALNRAFTIPPRPSWYHQIQPKYLRICSQLLPFLHDHQKTFFAPNSKFLSGIGLLFCTFTTPRHHYL